MKNIWIILIIGILIRVFLSFSTTHPDIQSLNAAGKVVAQGHVLDLYDYSSEAVVFNYPPSIYWFFGILNFLFGDSLELLKLSYLIFDIFLGFLLLKLIDPRKAAIAFGLWIFNPISLYATYMMGQFDIIPTFFTVVSLYLATKNKLKLAALALGFGVAFKLYPIFLCLPLIILGKTFWEKMRLGILTILPYILSIIPYLGSPSFRSQALVANQTDKSLYASIPLSGGEAILLFPASLIFFYLLIWGRQMNKLFFWRFFLIPLLLFFIFTHFHPQWLIWVTPFLILDLVTERFKNLLPILLIFITWVSSLFFFDASLTVGIFAPLLPILKNTPDIWTQLGITLDYNLSRSILQTVFASAAFYLIVKYFPGNEKA